MSRYQLDPPDDDRYSDRPIDVQDDLPDGDEDVRVFEGISCTHGVSAAIDPAEHAQHALIDALTTIEQQIVLATTMERLSVLKALTKRAYDYVNLVDLKCTAQMNLIREARR